MIRSGEARAGASANDMAVEVTRLGASAGDLAAVEAMSRESFADTALALTEELTRPWSRIWIAREVSSGSTERHRRDRDCPVGFLVAWHVADELHILNVATASAMRRRGVATALLAQGLDYARSQAIRILILEVRRSNRAAIKLYRKLGFTALGMRPGYYADNGEDAIEMMLGLDPATGAVVPSRDEIRIDG
jgi:[ribosomal protein S18]-alanine N-acetyltransferase